MISWGGIPHVGILVSDTPAAEAFYCGVLGMVDENDVGLFFSVFLSSSFSSSSLFLLMWKKSLPWFAA